MPAFVGVALLSAGVTTAVGYAAGTIAVGAVTSTFITAFATSLVLGGISKELPKRPQDDHP